MNGEELDKLETDYLYEEEREKSENILITVLDERFLQLCRRTSERQCMNFSKLLVYSFIVLRQFILEYKNIGAMG